MQITKGIEIIDLALFIKEESTLIFSDFHLGYEESITSKGTLIPRFQFQDTVKRLEHIFEKVGKVKKIIINGDIKHEFGKISDQEWREILKLFDFFLRRAKDVIVIKGNHDPFISPIAKKRNIKVQRNMVLHDILITHGDTIDEQGENKNIQTIIIGHEHPAITLTNKTKSEKYKCFLKGTWEKKELLVQPSFNLLVEGTNVLGENLLSPYLEEIEKFEVFIVSKKETLYFGKIKDVEKKFS